MCAAGVRLGILVDDVGGKYLRYVLLDSWQRVRGAAWDRLSGTIFWDELLSESAKRDILHKEEDVKISDPSSWDVTLLTKLIMALFKKEELISRSCRRLDGDIKQIVGELKNTRNKIKHLGTTQVSHEVFHGLWFEARENIRQLHGKLACSDELDEECDEILQKCDGALRLFHGDRILIRALLEQVRELINARTHDTCMLSRERFSPAYPATVAADKGLQEVAEQVGKLCMATDPSCDPAPATRDLERSATDESDASTDCGSDTDREVIVAVYSRQPASSCSACMQLFEGYVIKSLHDKYQSEKYRRVFPRACARASCRRAPAPAARASVLSDYGTVGMRACVRACV